MYINIYSYIIYYITVDINVHIMYMGLSENSVPLHPMVNDHYAY